ncbi:MAG: efflux RND transporter permease subunit, partial [Gammaproteobacteria bacterium]
LSDGDLERIRQIALAEPLLVGRLLSPQAHATGVNITVELPGEGLHEVPEVVSFVRGELLQPIQTEYPDIEFYTTGVVLLNNAFPEASQNDMKFLIPLAFLAIVVGLFIFLRSITGTIAALIVIFFSIMLGMGSTGWLGIKLTPPSATAPTIILTLAVADCVHFLSTMLHSMRQGMAKHDAIRESLRINLHPIFLTSVTTAIGFLSMNFSDAPPFHDLGNITAMGVMYAFVLSVLFLPALMAVLPVRVKQGVSDGSRTMERLANFVIERRRPLFWSLGLLTIVFVTLIPRNELNDVFVHYFDESIEFRRHSDIVTENMTGMYFVDYSLQSGDSGGVSDPAFLKQVDAFADWLRQQPEVMHVNVVTDIFKRLNKNMHADDPQKYNLPAERDLAAQYLLLYEMSLPYGLDLNNQINVDKSSTRVSVTLQTLSTIQVLDLEKRVAEWQQENTPELVAHGASPTVMFSHIGQRNIRSMLFGTTLALVVISMILIFALRSLKLGLISLIPNLVPVGIAFGVWAVLVGEIGLSLSVVAAMTLGIVVDDTVHFLSKYVRARREQNLSPADAVRYAFSTVGVALTVTTAVLLAGFLVLSQSAFELNSGMGLLTAITIAIALFMDFLFLPPLLMKLEERRDAKDAGVSDMRPASA